MEASTIHSPAALFRPRITIGTRLLKLRTDEQLVALFRAGHEEAFRVIYDRYHKRLESYARQMLMGRDDAEDALQEVFVRAYHALLADDRQLAVKPWLFRIVHNRCIDQLRRRTPLPTDTAAAGHERIDDPVLQADARETVRRLLEDIRRLPEQQRAALLLRELSGISYQEVASVLDTTVPAVRSLLVRARMGLLRATEARDTACSEVREQLTLAHDEGVRAGSRVRNHLRDCPGCRGYRREMLLVRKRLTAVLPVGPLAALARAVGFSGGGATTTGGAAPAAALGTGGAASGVIASGNHVAALLAAALASTGGAVGLQRVVSSVGQTPARALVAHRHHGSPASRSAPGPAQAAWRSTPAGGSASVYAGGGPAADSLPGRSAGAHAGVADRSSATGASVLSVVGDGVSTGTPQPPTGTVGITTGTPTGPTPPTAPGATPGGPTGSVATGTPGGPVTGPTSEGTTSSSPAGTGSDSSGTDTSGVSSGDPGGTTSSGQSSTGTSPGGTDQGSGSTTSTSSGRPIPSGDGSGQTSSGSTTTSGSTS